MTIGREAFLDRVRQAVKEGNKAGLSPALPDRGGIAYQGGGEDPAATFKAACEAAGCFVYLPATVAEARTKIVDLVRQQPAGPTLLGSGPALDLLHLKKHLEQSGRDVILVAGLTEAEFRDRTFAAVVGISGVAHLIAETGSLVVRSDTEEPRSLSLLPPVHIVMASRTQILGDLFDLFPIAAGGAGSILPSCQVLITGPSKTGDIELKLVTGVHGPGEVHVFVLPE